MTVNSIPVSQIRLIMEYKSFPMWLCDAEGIQIAEGIVKEFQNDFWLCEELNDIQQIYNSLFVDTNVEFTYVGFCSPKDEQEFLSRLHNVSQYVKTHIGNKYLITDSFPLQL